MDDPEYSYFAPDRLVGVLGISDSDEPVSSAHLYTLIHLTSRFGAFIREGNRWEPLWQGWNPDPSLKYINFKADAYDKVVRAFDQSPEDFLYYEEFSEHQEILEWEGSFDNTLAPECFRDIEELINWIQDFVEPKPAVITYGRHRVSCGDMAWMYPHVQELEALREATEEYVLAQRKKSSSEKMEEQLTRIELYPPLTQAVHDAMNEAASLAANVDCLEEFEGELDFTAVGNYFNGSKASVKDLGKYYVELIALGLGYQVPLNQLNADNLQLVRDLSLKPEDRLEAWFIHGQKIELYQIMANTRFGLFARYGKGKWQPVLRSREEEDLYDMSGVTIVQLRPEREVEIFREFDAGKLQEMSIKDPALNKFKLEYRGDNPSGYDFYDRVNFNDKNTHSFSELRGVASRVVRDSLFDLRTRVKELEQEGVDVEALKSRLEVLNAVFKDEKKLSYYELHRLLVESS